MKVILLQDVARVGKRHQIVNVPDGHALNMLIPKHMAKPATPQNLKQVQAMQAKVSAVKESKDEKFNATAAAIKGTSHSLAVEANEQGHLFQAIKPEQIVEVITAAGHEVLVEQVELPGVVKETGEHAVVLKNGDDSVSFTLVITAK